MKRLKKGLKIFFLLLIVLMAAGFVYNLIWPKISRLESRNPGTTAFMKYRQKQAAKQERKLETRQEWVDISRIAPSLVNAVLIAEDDKFWTHKGFDFEAIRKAIKKNWERKSLSFGGSTITQQLVKNLYLSPAKSPIRKLREAVLTWRMERALEKKRILEIYLNVIEWGEGIYGIQSASYHYYGKSASSLTPEESALLAAFIPSPRRYGRLGRSPYLEKRTKEILDIMSKRGLLDTDR